MNRSATALRHCFIQEQQVVSSPAVTPLVHKMKTAACNLVTPIQSHQNELSHDHDRLISAAQRLPCSWYIPTTNFGAGVSKICKKRLSVPHSRCSDQALGWAVRRLNPDGVNTFFSFPKPCRLTLRGFLPGLMRPAREIHNSSSSNCRGLECVEP
jgi:hypothetical protein